MSDNNDISPKDSRCEATRERGNLSRRFFSVFFDSLSPAFVSFFHRHCIYTSTVITSKDCGVIVIKSRFFRRFLSRRIVYVYNGTEKNARQKRFCKITAGRNWTEVQSALIRTIPTWYSKFEIQQSFLWRCNFRYRDNERAIAAAILSNRIISFPR